MPSSVQISIICGLVFLGSIFFYARNQSHKLAVLSQRIEQLAQVPSDSPGKSSEFSLRPQIKKEICASFAGATWIERTQSCSLTSGRDSSGSLEARLLAVERRMDAVAASPAVQAEGAPPITAGSKPWKESLRKDYQRDYKQVKGRVIGEAIDIVSPDGKRDCVYPTGSGACEIGADRIPHAACREGNKVQVFEGPGSRDPKIRRTVYRCVAPGQ